MPIHSTDDNSDGSTDNPYRPLSNPDDSRMSETPPFHETIMSRFLFTNEHFQTTLARYRSQSSGFGLAKAIRIVVSGLFLVQAVRFLLADQLFSGALILVCSLILMLSRWINGLLALRAFRQSPHRNREQTLLFSMEGLQTVSEIEETRVRWAACVRAVFFDDGILLFRGTNMVNWVPDASLQNIDARSQLRTLISSNLPTTVA